MLAVEIKISERHFETPSIFQIQMSLIPFHINRTMKGVSNTKNSGDRDAINLNSPIVWISTGFGILMYYMYICIHDEDGQICKANATLFSTIKIFTLKTLNIFLISTKNIYYLHIYKKYT